MTVTIQYYGIHTVNALLLKHAARIVKIYVLNERHDQRMQQLLQRAVQQGVVCQSATRHELTKLAQDEHHQGVVALCQPLPAYREADLATLLAPRVATALVLVLDEVQDPHNLGACLRSADAAGVDAVIIPKNNSAALTPVVRKVACGAADIVPVVTVTNLARSLTDLKDMGIWLWGAAGEASTTIYQMDMKRGCGIVLGAEGKGLRRLTREVCDGLMQIPLQGSVSSLNVSVACGICLFEAVRQRSSA